jgi:hypothetical protein
MTLENVTMDRAAKEMLDKLAKTPNLNPELRRVLEHLYRVGRVVTKSPGGEFELRCRCTFTLGPARSTDEFVAPYNAHLAKEHAGEEIEPLPSHPGIRKVLYEPPQKN